MDNLLSWLSPEMLRTLKQLASSATAWDLSQTQHLESIEQEQENVRRLIGAIELASKGQTNLALMFERLHAVLGVWKVSKEPIDASDRQSVLFACQILQEYFQAIEYKQNYSDLHLFNAYAALCRLAQIQPHPLDLWPKSLLKDTHTAVLSAEVQAWFCSQARQRAQSFSPEELLQSESDLHAHILALLRSPDGRSSEVQPPIVIICRLVDSWLLQDASAKNNVAIAGLFHLVLTAYAAGQLKMDVWLKRLMLSVLKRSSLDEGEHLQYLSFYCYLGWQQAKDIDHSASIYPQSLIEMARWQPLIGAHYELALFGLVAPKKMDGLLLQIERAKQLLSVFSSEGEHSTQSQEAISFCTTQLGDLLVMFHPSAEPLAFELKRVCEAPKILTEQRTLQVELATVLLILESMLGHPTVQSHADFELRFNELARRLRCAQDGQAAGAFAPWMLALQQDNAWYKTNSQLVGEVKARLTSMEDAFRAREFDKLEVQVMSLRSIARSMNWDALAKAAQSIALQIRHGLTPEGEGLLANNLAAMGLFADMQGQSRHSAEALFTFDDRSMQLNVQGRSTSVLSSVPSALTTVQHEPESAGAEMQHLFLEEAAELLATANEAHRLLQLNPSDIEQAVVLRRAFHTLKGGARMVGMPNLAEIAWETEQQLNQFLAEKVPASDSLLADCHVAMAAISKLVPDAPMPPQLPAGNAQIIHQPQDWLDLPATKVIGELSISIALYNAYLNEADEWSRQLVSALSEWRLDSRLPLPVMTLTWAHALAGSSATVGFTSLSHLAKAMELLIERVHEEHFEHPDLPSLLELSANEVCRLLHQFAAGFIKEPASALLTHLAQLQHAISLSPPIEASPPVSVAPNLAVSVTSDLPEAVSEPSPSHDSELELIFAEESAALLPQLGASMRLWLQAPQQGIVNLDQRAQALRALHTLKGSARLVGQQNLAQQAHDLESAIESYADIPSQAQSDSLLQQYDQLSGLDHSTSLAPLPTAVTAAPDLSLQNVFVPAPSFSAIPSGEVIRVKLGLVDKLVNESGEILIARARLEAEAQRAQHTLTEMTTQVARLRDQLRELEMQTESQMQSRQTQFSDPAQGFDPLELDRFTRTQELTRFMAESLSDISTFQRSLQRSLNATEDDLAAQSRLAKDLQRHLLQTRMVPFDSVAERLHRLVRMSSQELGKLAELTIKGGLQELDRSVLERVTPAFEHLLRNSLVHGIEAPERRTAMGKVQMGQITIAITQNGNDVWVTVQDDGQGVDEKAVLERARDLDPTAALNTDPSQLIFMSGLSTAPVVSELAGRGIGMDVVRAQVLALGGRIEVQTQSGLGTSFKLILPLTTAVTQIVLVRTGTKVTALPANLIQTVLRVKQTQLDEATSTKRWELSGQACPFYRLSDLLQYPSEPDAYLTNTAPSSVLLLSSASQTIALCVDEVLGNQEAVVKNLGPQLSQMPGLAGMTVLPTGQTVLIYNPVALATVYGVQVAASVQSQAAEEAGFDPQNSADSIQPSNRSSALHVSPLVMVVDDSITMRRVLQRLLLREGYRTTQAADGKQALDMLRLERPALVLSDVEMPRMDGFELLKQIRSSEKLQDLPVVMITSRIADKHRDHAKSLGANEYLGKPYPEEELIALLRQYAPV